MFSFWLFLLILFSFFLVSLRRDEQEKSIFRRKIIMFTNCCLIDDLNRYDITEIRSHILAWVSEEHHVPCVKWRLNHNAFMASRLFQRNLLRNSVEVILMAELNSNLISGLLRFIKTRMKCLCVVIQYTDVSNKIFFPWKCAPIIWVPRNFRNYYVC